MKNKNKPILIGVIFSLVLLIIFGVFQEKEAKFLKLSTQWIILGILPIIVALFLAGYITKFKGFGVELENKVEELDIKSKSSFYYNIGELYRLQKRFDDAEDLFAAAYKINPKYPNALLGRAATLRDKCKYVVDEKENEENLNKSLGYCNDAIKIAKKINVLDSLGGAYLTMATVKYLLKYDEKIVLEDLRKAKDIKKGIEKYFIKDENAEFFKGDKYAEFFKSLGLN